MKLNAVLIVLSFLGTQKLWADELPKDTIKVVDVSEVVVIGTPKENRKRLELPPAVTLLSQHDIHSKPVNSIHCRSSL